jgi:hypothetical protein
MALYLSTFVMILIIAASLILVIIDRRQKEPLLVSMINLIANPRKYNHRSIAFFGVIDLDFEDEAVFLSQSDYDSFITKNAIAISDPDKLRKKYGAYNGKYVYVEGIFNRNQGIYALYSGSIRDIVRIRPVRNVRTKSGEREADQPDPAVAE